MVRWFLGRPAMMEAVQVEVLRSGAARLGAPAPRLGAVRFGAVRFGAAPAAGHVEAVRTSISAGGIWAMVVIVVACLAFWLIAVNVASIDVPARRRRRIAMALMREEALSGATAGEASIGGAPGRTTMGAAAVGAARLAEAVPGAGEQAASEQAVGEHTGSEQAGSEPIGDGKEPEPADGTMVPPSGAVRILGPEDDPIPSQRSAPAGPTPTGQDPRHAMPTQRTADTDQPERSATSDDDRR
jgi:hypothetical protein